MQNLFWAATVPWAVANASTPGHAGTRRDSRAGTRRTQTERRRDTPGRAGGRQDSAGTCRDAPDAGRKPPGILPVQPLPVARLASYVLNL